VAKAGNAISAAESTTASFARNEDTLIHLMKTEFAYYLAPILTLCPALRQQKSIKGTKWELAQARAPIAEFYNRRACLLLQCAA
jgi:hypothetical protein